MTTLIVRHPGTGEPIGAEIEIGDNTRAVLDYLYTSPWPHNNAEALRAACKTVNWSGVVWEGEELLYTIPDALMIYTALPWLAEQICRGSDISNLQLIAEYNNNAIEVSDLQLAVESATAGKPYHVPAAGQILWSWFWELDQTRGSSGFGPLPITYQEIEAWSRLLQIEIRPHEVAILRRMDVARLNALADLADKPKGISMDNAAGVAALLRGAGKRK